MWLFLIQDDEGFSETEEQDLQRSLANYSEIPDREDN